jgi:hypothetical protein
MKKNKLLPIPKFKNEDDERDFWDKADSSKYFDFSKMKHVKFPNLKMTDPEKLKELENSIKKEEKELESEE